MEIEFQIEMPENVKTFGAFQSLSYVAKSPQIWITTSQTFIQIIIIVFVDNELPKLSPYFFIVLMARFIGQESWSDEYFGVSNINAYPGRKLLLPISRDEFD